MPEERRAWLDASMPGWETLWPEALDAVRRAQLKKGTAPASKTRPEASSTPKGPFVSAARRGVLAEVPDSGRWLEHQRRREAAGEMPTSVRDRFDSAMPAWRTDDPETLDASRKAERRAARAQRPRREMPALAGTADLDARFLAAAREGLLSKENGAVRWLRAARRLEAAARLDPERIAAYGAIMPRWRNLFPAGLDGEWRVRHGLPRSARNRRANARLTTEEQARMDVLAALPLAANGKYLSASRGGWLFSLPSLPNGRSCNDFG
ncbi:hypothetical protein GCM10025867_46640 (plasmid) [Frondihabitans sucicola]|uniref:Uncharacterized protein n=1 Tax=Frondihabitans sucicola TaxID=1268041 RepID=A0ABN6Y5H3_9MICO|nr:hypothetical protein [Frondihabitans sucicola]BDZ52423.1 hypothetical protein GCM10025867_46640 [Frondihabitans sucicola]